MLGRGRAGLASPVGVAPVLQRGGGGTVYGFGCRVQGSGCSVQGAGFRVQGAGFRVQGAGFMLGRGRAGLASPVGVAPVLRVDVLGCGFGRWGVTFSGLGFRIWGLGSGFWD
jgi:hypothetical protein